MNERPFYYTWGHQPKNDDMFPVERAEHDEFRAWKTADASTISFQPVFKPISAIATQGHSRSDPWPTQHAMPIASPKSNFRLEERVAKRRLLNLADRSGSGGKVVFHGQWI